MDIQQATMSCMLQEKSQMVPYLWSNVMQTQVTHVSLRQQCKLSYKCNYSTSNATPSHRYYSNGMYNHYSGVLNDLCAKRVRKIEGPRPHLLATPTIFRPLLGVHY